VGRGQELLRAGQREEGGSQKVGSQKVGRGTKAIGTPEIHAALTMTGFLTLQRQLSHCLINRWRCSGDLREQAGDGALGQLDVSLTLRVPFTI